MKTYLVGHGHLLVAQTAGSLSDLVSQTEIACRSLDGLYLMVRAAPGGRDPGGTFRHRRMTRSLDTIYVAPWNDFDRLPQLEQIRRFAELAKTSLQLAPEKFVPEATRSEVETLIDRAVLTFADR